MCITPIRLPTGEVACRNCWQCRENRVNDLVGRCIAEARVATKTLAVTLTYEGDTPSSAHLNYADFQQFMKRLRRAGHKVRYIVAGEYGSQKGRAHWHAVLFFDETDPETPKIDIVEGWEMEPENRLKTLPEGVAKGYTPKVCLEDRMFWTFWPDGFVYFEKAQYEGFRYLMKYVLKQLDAPESVETNHLAMSKKPPLGTEYLKKIAEKHVSAGLGPKTWTYSFDDVFDKKGKRRKFYMTGRSREMFMNHFVVEWRKTGKPLPVTDLTIEYEDREIREKADRQMAALLGTLSEKAGVRWKPSPQWERLKQVGPDMWVGKNTFGLWLAMKTDHEGKAKWLVELETRGQIKAAILGTLLPAGEYRHW